jgi:hypothetical protein
MEAGMTEFFGKTWFIWWVIATLAFLRWFHTVSLKVEVAPEPEDAGLECQDMHGSSSHQLNSLPL